MQTVVVMTAGPGRALHQVVEMLNADNRTTMTFDPY